MNDLPDGAGRYIQRASRYDDKTVSGQVFMDHDEHAEALPGSTLRS